MAKIGPASNFEGIGALKLDEDKVLVFCLRCRFRRFGFGRRGLCGPWFTGGRFGRFFFQLRFKGGNACPEPLIFLAGENRHLPHGVEFLAHDDIHFAQNPLGLGPHQSVDLSPHALGGAGGIGHHFGKFVEKSAGGLGHNLTPGVAGILCR